MDESVNSGVTEAALPRPTVLYIEDNPANLRLVEKILAMRLWVNLLSAMEGRVGLEMALAHRPDLILLDLHLPDLMGQDVYRHLQEASATRDIPVVVVSADASPDRIRELREAGVYEYLTKPLNIKRFIEVIDECLGGRARLAESTESTVPAPPC